MKYCLNEKYDDLEQVYIILTKECNLSCPYCIREFDNRNNNFISLEKVDFIFNKLAKFQTSSQIILSGGEPTLHPEALSIITLAKKYFQYVSIASNGTNFNFFINSIGILQDMHVQISVDGTQEIHDKLRGLNSFQRTYKTILLLVKYDIDLTVASTVNSDNIKSFKNLFHLFESIGIKKWKISPEIQTYKSTNRQNKTIGTEQWNRFVKEIEELTINWSGKVNIKTLFDFVGKEIPWNLIDNSFIKNTGCQPGLKKLYIYPDLSVIGCPCLETFPLGNLKTDDLSNIIGKKAVELNNQIMEKEDSICSECEYFRICKGGCPGASFREFGIINKSDPRCPLV